MLLRRALHVVPIVAFVACGTGSDPDADGSLDAAADTAVADARDSAPPRDTAVEDSGPPDAGPDDPGWVPWVTLHDDCVIERATHPERIGAGPPWEPCEEHPTGCLRAENGGHEPAWFDGTHGYFAQRSIDVPRSTTQHRLVLVRTDGRVIAAWREPPLIPLIERNRLCRIRLGGGDGYVAPVAIWFNGDDRSESLDWVFHIALEDLDEPPVEPFTVVSPGQTPQEIHTSEELVVYWTGPTVFGIATDDGRQRLLNAGLSGIPQNVTVIGDHVWWEDWAARVQIAHATVDTPAEIFYGVAPGDTKGFQTDGVELMWMEGYDRQPDGRYDRLELHAAPYTEDPAALDERYVRDMAARTKAVGGGGWYTIRLTEPDRLHIANTADGTLRVWPHGTVYPPLYVTENEILMNTAGFVRLDPNVLPIVEE